MQLTRGGGLLACVAVCVVLSSSFYFEVHNVVLHGILGNNYDTHRGSPSPSRNSPHTPPLATPSTTIAISPSPRTQYLLLLTSSEGMSGWIVALAEAMALAARLGRVFVLPCVRGGALTPCEPGKVISVPDGSIADAGSSTVDLLALPAFREECNPYVSSIPPANGRAYPLHAYFSPSSIKNISDGAGGGPYVNFDTWAHARLGSGANPPDHVFYRSSNGILEVPLPLLTVLFPGECEKRYVNRLLASKPARMGVFNFTQGVLCVNVSSPSAANGMVASNHPMLLNSPYADAPDVFFANWMRSEVGDTSISGFPAFNALHYAPVRRWVAALAGSSHPTPPQNSTRGDNDPARRPYAVVQWRSETVSEAGFPACAAAVIDQTKILATTLGNAAEHNSESWGSAVTYVPVPLVVVADLMPTAEPGAPPPCRLSTHYHYGTDDVRTSAMSSLLAIPGAFSYPASQQAAGGNLNGSTTIDAGVLAIRDYILALEAQSLITCLTRFSSVARSQQCSDCYWTSEFVYRVVVHRAQLGRMTFPDLWRANASSIIDEVSRRTPSP